jgi:hypothetical protein
MSDGYDSEYGKDAWKKWRRIVESIESPIQDMLHEFGAEMYEQGQRDMLARCIAAVEEVPAETTTHGDDWRDIPGFRVRRDALDTLRALDPDHAVVEHLADLDIDRARDER